MREQWFGAFVLFVFVLGVVAGLSVAERQALPLVLAALLGWALLVIVVLLHRLAQRRREMQRMAEAWVREVQEITHCGSGSVAATRRPSARYARPRLRPA